MRLDYTIRLWIRFPLFCGALFHNVPIWIYSETHTSLYIYALKFSTIFWFLLLNIKKIEKSCTTCEFTVKNARQKLYLFRSKIDYSKTNLTKFVAPLSKQSSYMFNSLTTNALNLQNKTTLHMCTSIHQSTGHYSTFKAYHDFLPDWSNSFSSTMTSVSRTNAFSRCILITSLAPLSCAPQILMVGSWSSGFWQTLSSCSQHLEPDSANPDLRWLDEYSSNNLVHIGSLKRYYLKSKPLFIIKGK